MEFIETLKIFLWAMTPIGELRAAIPIGLSIYKINPATVYCFSVLGNIFAVFLILVFLGAFSRWSSQKFKVFNRFFTWLFSRTMENHSGKVDKYGLWLLPLFVAIPLPVTGGWTGSLIAFVFNIPFKKAFPLISLGVIIAGLIVLFLTQAGIVIERNFGWQVLIGILFVISLSYWLYKKLRK